MLPVMTGAPPGKLLLLFLPGNQPLIMVDLEERDSSRGHEPLALTTRCRARMTTWVNLGVDDRSEISSLVLG